jgi:DNA-binding PadR family transcriptional regulator
MLCYCRSISNGNIDRRSHVSPLSPLSLDHKNLYVGLIRLHILHHAAGEPIFGLGMIQELAEHGYKLSAGTLYPVLHSLEASGYLRSRAQLVDGRRRRFYRATPAGRKALAEARTKVKELFGEMFEED